jgi:RNA polymerase sigma factor (TIGR02999 family)
MQHGDGQAGEKAMAMVYSELHRIASRELRDERPGHLLQTTALIHEAYIRLTGSRALEIQSRKHFFAVASQQMRRILVDHARARDAQKRGDGAVQVGLEAVRVGMDPRKVDLVLLDQALGELEHIDRRAAQAVELRFFGGYSDVATVRRDWEFARSWLFERMHGGL